MSDSDDTVVVVIVINIILLIVCYLIVWSSLLSLACSDPKDLNIDQVRDLEILKAVRRAEELEAKRQIKV